MASSPASDNGNGMAIGRLVEVQSRTWPGINKPGGIARVTNVHWSSETPCFLSHVDVQYILGSNREKNVPVDYVQLAPQYENHSSRTRSKALRDRSMLLGRCRRCGSLRTDCGSCDWATEEHNDRDDGRAQPLRKRQLTSKAHKDNNDYSSESSSSEEDIVLQEFLEQNQRKYRKYLRCKLKFNQSHNNNEKRRKPKNNRTAPTNENAATSSSSEEEDPFYQANASSYQSYLKGKAQWRRRQRQAQRRQRTSVLESLAQTPNTHNGAYGAEEIPPLDGDIQSQLHQETYKDEEDVIGGSPMVGAAMYSSNSDASMVSVSRPEIDSSDDDDAHMPPSIEGHYFPPLADGSQADGGMIALSQFIQPEGLEVAENLPQDTVDRTKDLPYHKLPLFFDTMATRIEDDWVPDWKLRIAKLTRAKRQLEIQLSATNVDPKQVLQECQDAVAKVREKLIRNGTDQCRVALHKLMDDRIYRKTRSTLSSQQRRICRGSGILEARNLRMDALDQAVEDLVRKLRDVMHACEERVQESPLTAASENDSEDDFEHFAQNDPSPIKASLERPNTNNSVPPLSPLFHRHMHASRVKHQRETFVIHTKKRTKKANPATSSRKRAKSSCSGRRNKRTVHTSSTIRQREVSDKFERQGDLAAGDEKENEVEHANECVYLNTEASSGPGNLSDGKRRAPRKHATGSSSFGNHRVSTAKQRTQKPSRSDNKESQVPTFNLFDQPHIFSGGQTEHQSWRGESISRSRSRVPISRRMQAFLDANSGDGYDLCQEEGVSGDNGTNALSRRSQRQRSRNSGRQTHGASSVSRRVTIDGEPHARAVQAETSNRMQDVHDEETETAGDCQVSCDASLDNSLVVSDTFFLQLDHRYVEEAGIVEGSRTVNIAESCRQLGDAYPQSPDQCLVVLGRLHSTLAQPAVASGNGNVVFLETCFSILKNHGTLTLQELVTAKSSILKLHVKLLSECFHSLARVSQDSVKDPGSVLGRVTANIKTFSEALVLQLVDTVYALLHPEAWALQITDRSRILATLCPLRDALAKVTPLVEAASRCVVERLGSQKWRRGLTPNHAFVSCIGADDWKEYLLKGVPLPQPPEIRIQALGKMWPRLETEALWSLLAFLARSESMPEEKSNSRWQLISKLFSYGVLARDENETGSTDPLPPSTEQLSACEKEIGFFQKLLRTGCLDNLPSSDSIVVNLIRRGLTLQADDYISNATSRGQCCPGIGRGAKEFVALLWKASHPLYFIELHSVRPKIDSSYSVQFNDKAERETLSLENLLVPSSNVVKRCLELLPTWICRLPDKKARQRRLHRSLNTLRGALLSDTSERSKHDSAAGTKQISSFESAFGSRPDEDMISGVEHTGSFMREATAWLKIVELYSLAAQKRSNQGDSSIFSSVESVAEIWEIVSCENMKGRRIALMEKRESRSTFTGDSVSLLVAAKVMASIVLLQLNICPWILDIGASATQFPTNADISEQAFCKNDSFAFSMACIAASLDCLCDLLKESPFTAHLYSIVTLVFTNCTACLQLDGTCFLNVQTRDLLVSLFAPVLVRCFNVQINSPGGPDHSMTFRLLLSAIRSFSSFLAIAQTRFSRNSETQTQTQSADKNCICGRSSRKIDADEDEIWGSIDDALLASMNLNVGNESVKSHSSEEQLSNCLQIAIQQSKPSERFLIFQDYGGSQGNDRLHMSAHGKHAVAKDVERVCDCLVALQAIDAGNKVGSHISFLIVQPVQSFFEDSNDAQFSCQVAQRICSELTSLSKNSTACREFVKEHSEIFTFTFLQRLLDSRRLEIFPSCNLEGIRDIGGDPAGEQALALLDAFNNCSQTDAVDGTLARLQRKQRRKAYSIWNACKELGYALSEQSTGIGDFSFREALAAVLQERDIDLPSKPDSFLDAQSLEQETLECLRLLRTLVSLCKKCDSQSRASIESVMAFSLALVVSNTLKIVRSLQYQDSHEARNPGGDKTMRRIKTQELLCAYVEMFTTLVSWILRERRRDVSDQWNSLELRLRDSFLSPVLQRKHVDLTISFQQILYSSVAVITGTRSQASETIIGGISGCSQYFGNLDRRIVRRSRQLLLASSKCSHLLSIQSYLVEAVAVSVGDAEDQNPLIVGASFNPSLTNLCLSSDSPLQDGIDEYICFVERSANDSDTVDLMKSAESNFLESFVLPRLNHGKTGSDIKRRLLRVVGKILDGVTDVFSIEMSILKSLVKGLRISLLQSFGEEIVDDSFVSALFACSSSFANVPAHMGNDRKQSLISWCRGIVHDPTKENMLDLSKEEASGTYFWLYFKWLCNIGSMVINTGNMEKENNNSFRNFCRSDQQQDDDSPISLVLIREEADLNTSHGLLNRGEKYVFPSTAKGNLHVVNVYAKAASSSKSSNGLLPKWTPATAPKKAAKEFMAEVVALGF